MKHLLIFILLVGLFLPATGDAKKTTYIATNQRLNYVKLDEISLREAERRVMSHPADIDEATFHKALSRVTLAKHAAIGDGEKVRELFDEEKRSFLAVNFSKAFRQAKETEEVVFSFIEKNPRVILRNDRLTVGRAWLHGDELHIVFKKKFAKMTGDYSKRGTERKAAARARDVRSRLEIKPGQKFGPESTNHLILDLNFTPSADDAAQRQAPAKEEKREEKEMAVPQVPSESPSETTNKVKRRLEQLEDLKKEGLISKREYEEKRKEILKDL